MKKLILIFFGIAFFQLSHAQSFFKHALVLSGDYGFEAYSTSQQYTVQDLGTSKTINSSISATNFSAGAEFGVFSWLGLGLQGKLDNYSIAKDSTGYQPKAASGEIGAVIDIHFIHIDKMDLLAGVNIGYSSFNYSYTNNSFNYQYSGGGLWTDVHATFRYYFGSRFGIHASAYIPLTNYSNLSSNYSDWQSGQSVLNQWKNTGGGFSLGIQFRLFSLPKV